MNIWQRAKPSDDRSSVSRDLLQSAITEAVKKADHGCEAFAGVVMTAPDARTGDCRNNRQQYVQNAHICANRKNFEIFRNF